MVIALSAPMATRPTFGALTFGSSARRSTSARVAGVLLAPTASLATARPASRGSVVPFSHEFTRTRRKLGYVMDNDSIRTARDAWLADATAAEATYGHISTWDVSGVTDMSYLFCARHPWMESHSDFPLCQLPQSASSFNEDISAWDISGVTNMYRIFRSTSDFDQNLGWCVDPAVLAPGGGETVESVHESSCESTMCGIVESDSCDGVMTDSNIRTAVAAWLSDATAAEAAYSHISTWETSGVTDMSNLFSSSSNSGAEFFNEDIGAWDTSGVKSTLHMFRGARAFNRNISGWSVHKVGSMYGMFRGANAFNQDIGGWAVDSVSAMDAMFRGAKSFNQDLGWCVDAKLDEAFTGTKCEKTSCGVKKEAFGTCDEGAIAGIITAIVLSCLLFLLAACFCCYYKKRTKVRAVAPATSEEAPAPPASVVSVVDAPAAGIAPNELGTVVAVEQPPANQR